MLVEVSISQAGAFVARRQDAEVSCALKARGGAMLALLKERLFTYVLSVLFAVPKRHDVDDTHNRASIH